MFKWMRSEGNGGRGEEERKEERLVRMSDDLIAILLRLHVRPLLAVPDKMFETYDILDEHLVPPNHRYRQMYRPKVGVRDIEK